MAVDSDLIQSLTSFVVGVGGVVTAAILALKRRAQEEELPALRQQNEELREALKEARRETAEARRETAEARRETAEARQETIAAERRSFGLERLAARAQLDIPEHLQRTEAIIRPIQPVRAEDEG